MPVTEPLRDLLENPIPDRMLDSLKPGVRELLIQLFGSKPTFGEMVALKMVQSSARGDVFATNSVLDRAEGKVTQKAELTGKDGEALVFSLRRVDQE